MIEGTLSAQHFELELLIERYERPELDSGRDGNALACVVHLGVYGEEEDGDFQATYNPLLYNFELARFTDQLRALAHEGSGEAALGDPDTLSGDELGLSIRIEDGEGTLDGFLGWPGARMSFALIDIDESFVTEALALFEEIVEAFPVRGEISAD